MKRIILLLLLTGCGSEIYYPDVDYSEIDCNKHKSSLVIDTEEYCKNRR